MLNYRVFYKRPTVQKSEVIKEFKADNFHAAYIIATKSLLEQLRKEEKKPTLQIVMLAQLPKKS